MSVKCEVLSLMLHVLVNDLDELLILTCPKCGYRKLTDAELEKSLRSVGKL